jgi:1,4-dihydroxy-2-naphthoate octaprenyltransferase
LATVAFYIAMAGKAAGGAAVTVPAIVASVAILLGCTTAFILFTSHFHQEQGDRAAGKLSPVVRLGLPGALLVADNLIGAHYATIATLAAAGWLPYTAVFGLIITYPLARHIVDFAQDRADAGAIEDLFYTKYLAVRYHVVHGILLALGVVAQRAFLSPDLFFAPL